MHSRGPFTRGGYDGTDGSEGSVELDASSGMSSKAVQHHRELPACVQLAAQDRCVLAMLGARGTYVAAASSDEKKSGSQPDLTARVHVYPRKFG